MNIVIGSGPAGVSCAMALIGLGQPVTMLDGGGELEPGTKAAVERLRTLDPASWRGGETAFLKRNVAPDRKSTGVKYSFGSDFPYRDAEKFIPMSKTGCDTTASFATGGFSNVWGATLLPYLSEDTKDWPFPISELGPHYRAVLSFMDSSVEEDELAEMFPLLTGKAPALRRSRQADALLADLRKHHAALNDAGLAYGSARLAVRSAAKAGMPGCVYCGLCMYGCPYGLIYSASSTLRILAENRLFRRFPRSIVEAVEETARGVVVKGRSRDGDIPFELSADKVYLAAGPLSTTQILLRSLRAYDRPVELKDSQYFLFPMLRYSAEKRLPDEELHTLAQVFLEIRDPAVSPNTVHLQIYTYNELYAGAIRKSMGGAARFLGPAIKPIVNRMLIAQGYLHSDHSTPIEITLQRRQGGSDLMSLVARPREGRDIDAALKKVVRKIAANSGSMRAIPLGLLLQKTEPGRGYHSGGTFPMRLKPKPMESDVLGRPSGFDRVHAVDSTVFPSIPATTITFSVMANAHRIATQSHGA
jgi:choline dehydrogenase-like flavoprotein